MINMDLILKKAVDNIDIVIAGGSLIVIPIIMAVKIKLDKLTASNNMYFPSVEKYEKLFKQHKLLLNDQVKKPSSNKKGW